jgi:protein-disulfide isomerase
MKFTSLKKSPERYFFVAAFFALVFMNVNVSWAEVAVKSEISQSDDLQSVDEVNKILAQNPKHPGIGSFDAPVKFLMFQDLNCGMCAAFFNEILPILKKRYVDTGKVRVEFVESLLIPNEQSRAIGSSALCAAEQNKYIEMVTHIYSLEKRINLSDLNLHAKQAGLDVERFHACMQSGQVTKQLNEDIKTGRALEVAGTPTFFINGERVVGYGPPKMFSVVIDRFIKK